MEREAPTVEDGRTETEGQDAVVVRPARTAERANVEDTDRSMAAAGDGVDRAVFGRSSWKMITSVRIWILGFQCGMVGK
jgi:hypothetical protein